MTRTAATNQAYSRRAERLIARVRQARGIDQPSLTAVVDWMKNQKSQWARSTWRQNRAALMHYIEQHKNDDAKETMSAKIEALIAIERLEQRDSEALRRGRETSSKKMKKLTAADLHKLISYFQNAPQIRHGQATLVWALAGLSTGLRPVEWKHASCRIDSAGNPLLTVNNAKHTNGRAHGTLRTIHLGDMSIDEQALLKQHLAYVAAAKLSNGGFERHYHCCRDCLYEANKKLWPRRKQTIALYTARHQFTANAKAAGLTKVSIAALLGHASEETAAMHYGRGVSGRVEELRVKADAGDVARVEQLNAHRHETQDYALRS